jgi:hypothetical protein
MTTCSPSPAAKPPPSPELALLLGVTRQAAGTQAAANRSGGRAGMLERSTREARQTVTQSQAEAREVRHQHIGTEHLLLALLAQLRRAPPFSAAVPEPWPDAGPRVTPCAEKVLELSVREALAMEHRPRRPAP